MEMTVAIFNVGARDQISRPMRLHLHGRCSTFDLSPFLLSSPLSRPLVISLVLSRPISSTLVCGLPIGERSSLGLASGSPRMVLDGGGRVIGSQVMFGNIRSGPGAWISG